MVDRRSDRIRLVTDADVGRHDVRPFFTDLLDQVRRVLKVDTAVVLLLDMSGEYLVATAARGVEEEVYQGFRLPVGTGFAGRVAAERRPVAILAVDRATVRNPVLLDKGVRSLLGVPMLADGQLIGILHVGTLTPRRFTDDDVALLQSVAEQATRAAQARQAEIERTAASALQRSLLPPRLPAVGGLELAARYAPAELGGIGGDWYDVFVLPSGWVGIVIGDVIGHNLRAAVVMGRLRSALRAYALDEGDPATVLTKLDRKVHHFEPDMMATVLYAMVEPSLERMHLSLAGHFAPVVAVPGRRAELPAVPTDLPVGVRLGLPRATTAVDIAPGAVVCFYTDGLFERRGEGVDDGLERLRDALFAGPSEQVCAAVMADMVGGDPPSDDIAMLVMRRAEARPGTGGDGGVARR